MTDERGLEQSSNIKNRLSNIMNDVSPPEEYELPPNWKISHKGKKAIEMAQAMISTRHGLYASIPLVCKGNDCPHISTCGLDLYDMSPEGERCPLEIAKMDQLYKKYANELEIDEESQIDLSLLKELIDVEITIDRADSLLAQEGSFIQDVTVSVTENGHRVTRPEIHKAAEIKDKLSKRKQEVMKNLNATRKDKAKEKKIEYDPATYASELIKKGKEKMKEEQNTIDVTLDGGDEDEKNGE